MSGLAGLRGLRAEETRLFGEVRAHRFADLTESNYWHRGRLKLPGRIEQILEGNDGQVLPAAGELDGGSFPLPRGAREPRPVWGPC